MVYLSYLTSNLSLASQYTFGVNESIEETNKTDIMQIFIHLTLKYII